MRNCLEIGDQGNNDDRYDDYFRIRIIIVTMTYGDAGNDQGHSHDDDWLWIIYDEIEDVSLGFVKLVLVTSNEILSRDRRPW